MGTQIQGISSGMQMMGPQIQGITSGMQELLSYQRNQAICQYCKKKLIDQGMDERKPNPYELGQDIFYFHDPIDMNSVLNTNFVYKITVVVMMDDGRLVMCYFPKCILYICNTEGSQAVTIPVKDNPFRLTSVNSSTVAVTVGQSFRSQHIEIYDINNKHNLKSIQIPGKVGYRDITMVSNKLVVSADKGLVIVDYQAGEIVQNVETHCEQINIHSFGDRIMRTFYRDYKQSKIHWYSFTDDKLHTLTLPSISRSMTILQDGTRYVLCTDGSVQHVSSNGIHFKTLKTNQSQCFSGCHKIRYNSKQKKMVTLNVKTGNVRILYEI